TAGLRGRIGLAILIGLLAAGFGIARFALLGALLARVFSDDGFAIIAILAAGVAAAVLLRALLDHARTVIAHNNASRVQEALRGRLYDKIAELGPAWFAGERTGGVMLSLVDGVEQLQSFFGQYLPQVCVAALTPLAIFAFIVWWDPPVATVMLVAALITLVAPIAWNKVEGGKGRVRHEAMKSFGSEFLDAVQGLPTLKAFGQSTAYGRKLAERARQLSDSTMRVLSTSVLTRGITDCGIAIGAAAALALGVWRVADGRMTIEALLIVLMAGTEVFRPLRDLGGGLHQGMVGQSVAAGEKIAMAGPSGSGKSSIARLLLRLFDPQSGMVRVGGQDLRTLDPEALRRLIAVVHQDTYLFHGTVEENLRLGKPDATQAELEAAARDANAHEFIRQLPQGYQTVIGERGVNLSGGQRQRLAIARALLRDSPILILDEALSSVDAENVAVVQQGLERVAEGR